MSQKRNLAEICKDRFIAYRLVYPQKIGFLML